MPSSAATGRRGRAGEAGFTLIELMIAITMLAVIVGILGGALSMAYSTAEKGEKKIGDLERRRIIDSLFESQIQSAFVSYVMDEGEKKNRFAGKKDALTFASHYSAWRGTSGNCLVTYRVETDGRQKARVTLEEQVLGMDVTKQTTVRTNYDSISFSYYLQNVLEEGSWVDEWPAEEQTMPQKIRIHFTTGDKTRTLTAAVFTALSSAPVASRPSPVITR